MKATEGEWYIRKEKLGKLPPLHIMTTVPGPKGPETIYLASIHDTHVKGEEMANARLFGAASAMYEAITVGLTGRNLAGDIVSQADAVAMLKAAKEKAEKGNQK